MCINSSFPKKDVMFIGAFPWELYALSTNDVCAVNVQMCLCVCECVNCVCVRVHMCVSSPLDVRSTLVNTPPPPPPLSARPERRLVLLTRQGHPVRHRQRGTDPKRACTNTHTHTRLHKHTQRQPHLHTHVNLQSAFRGNRTEAH